MKYFLPFVCLLAILSAQQTVALKKVTQTVTLTGVSEAQLNEQKAKILKGIAAILNVPEDKVVPEADVVDTTTVAPKVTTAAPVSAAPTTAASGRRLASITFTYSVIVANQAEADAIKAKMAKNDFATKLVKEVAKATGVSESAIVVVAATPSVDNYTPTTTAPPKKGVVSASERNAISFIAYMCVSLCIMFGL